MKKNLEKISASASIVVAVILIMILIVTVFGGINTDEFNSELVRGLMITLAILYIVLASISLAIMFINSEVVKDVVVRTDKGGSARVSANVITKIVKNACHDMDGVKCKKVVLVQDDYGVRLKINVKVVDKDVIEVETRLRLVLEDMFMGEFGYRFESIEVKVMVLTPKYKPDEEKIAALTEEKVAEIKAQQEAMIAAEEAAKAEQEAKIEEKVEAAQTVVEATVVEEQAAEVSEEEPVQEDEE
ncbi:MAG: hypothetical protein K2M36_05415 [Clostridia bacterium]|nr:hypothetical protein [Clostridia bacterium]